MRMSKFQTKITHFAKDQKDLKLNEQKIINRAQPWNDRDVRLYDKDFKALMIKMFQQAVYEYAQNKWKSRKSQQRYIRHKKGSICELKDITVRITQYKHLRDDRLEKNKQNLGDPRKYDRRSNIFTSKPGRRRERGQGWNSHEKLPKFGNSHKLIHFKKLRKFQIR